MSNPRVHHISEKWPEGAWSGDDCFIIGGGPSLRGFDFERLRGRGRVIATNKAYQVAPWSDIAASLDVRFYGWCGDDPLLQRHDCPLWMHGQGGWPYDWDIYIITGTGENFWGTRWDEGVNSSNSGLAAMNVADLLGVSRMYLLGFDLKSDSPDNKQAWWHSGYPAVQKSRVYANFLKCFGEVHQRGCISAEVINCNPDSALSAWPRVSLESVLG